MAESGRTPQERSRSDAKVPNDTWPKMLGRWSGNSAGGSTFQYVPAAIWLRSRSLTASCERKTSGQWAESSRPIPAKWFPMPGKTKARPEVGPGGSAENATRSPTLGLSRPSPATRRRAVAIPSSRSAEPSATTEAASRRDGSPGFDRHHSRARASDGAKSTRDLARASSSVEPLGRARRCRPPRSRTEPRAGGRSDGARSGELAEAAGSWASSTTWAALPSTPRSTDEGRLGGGRRPGREARNCGPPGVSPDGRPRPGTGARPVDAGRAPP